MDVDDLARRAALGTDDLRQAGFAVWPEHGQGDEPVAFFANLSECNELTAPVDVVWVPVASDAEQISVGPLFRGGNGDSCRACLARRAWEHDDFGRFLASVPGATRIQEQQVSFGVFDAQVAFVRDAINALRELPEGTILVRRAQDGEVAQARAISCGGCDICNAPSHKAVTEDHPAILRPGGYRPVDAADMLARLHDVVDPVTGIVRQLVVPSNDPATGDFAKLCTAQHAFPLAVPDILAVIRNRRGRSAGKGRTDDQARVGAIAEALERYVGVARADDPVHFAHRSALEGDAIAPSDWSLYSQAQLDAAQEWRALNAPAAWVPQRFDPDARIGWTQVYDASDGSPGWAPAALCWHQFPETAGALVPGRGDSNGCAAGQTATDARLQGLLELVERDAVGIWWWSRSRRPEIDPDSLNDPWISQAFTHLSAMGYVPALQDLTHDLNIPVVAAIAWPKGDTGPLLLGFGAHLSPQVAASRALTEVMQVLPTRVAFDIGGDPRQGFGVVPGAKNSAASVTDDFGFLRPNGIAVERFQSVTVPDTAQDALEAVSRQIRAMGLRIWVLDQSRPDVPLPVFRMIVPGLRHFRPRFAPGRLDTVPSALGWTPGAGGQNRLFIRQ